MRQNVIIKFFKHINPFTPGKKISIGRWDTKDNSAIKATLANMDSCGDNLCGDPKHFSKNIEKILKETCTKIDL